MDFVKATVRDLAILHRVRCCQVSKSLPSLGGASLIADMQIFFGTCLFLVAVVMLAYVPGKLLLLLLKRTLTPVGRRDFGLCSWFGGQWSRLLVDHSCSPGALLPSLAADRCRSFCLALL